MSTPRLIDFRLNADEFVDTASSLGHSAMSLMPGSYGRTWACDRCEARVYRLDGRLHGWAVEYTCDEVAALRNNEEASTP